MQRYVYKITLVDTGEFYHGIRVSKFADPKELWVTYFTSSKRVKSLIEQYGREAFVHEIVFCGSYEEVLSMEVELIDRHWNDPLSLNRNKAGMLKPECFLPENWNTDKRKASWERDSQRKRAGDFTPKERQQFERYSARRSAGNFTERELAGFAKLSSDRKSRLQTTGFTDQEKDRISKATDRKRRGDFTERERAHYTSHSQTMSNLKWFNDGTSSCRKQESPGPGWAPGRLLKDR